MSYDNRKLVRDLLKKNPDGLTAYKLGQLLDKDMRLVKQTLLHMCDVYIDRYEDEKKLNNSMRKLVPVYIAVPIPEDAPHPAGKVAVRRESSATGYWDKNRKPAEVS